MNDHRAILNLLRFAKRRNQRARVVTIDVADVLEAQLIDQCAGKHRRRNRVLHGLGRVMQSFAD